MNDMQYEELCRRFIAEKENLSLTKVRSGRVPNPKRGRLPVYEHQIDLYWETGSEIATYLHIANAKWRASEKIRQSDVELLQHVRQKVAAHKAFLITNSGFTAGAIAAAKDEGIALHIVRHDFESADLPKKDRAAIQASLAAIKAETARRLWTHHVEHKGLGFDGDAPKPHATPGSAFGPQPPRSAARLICKPAHQAPPSTAPLLHKPAQPTTAPPAPPSVGGGESPDGPGWGPSGDRSGGFVKK
jgi:hypothetical protein